MILEVQGRGFVQVPWHVWKKKNILLALYEMERDPAVVKKGMTHLGTRLGDPYDTYSLIGFLLVFVVKLWDRNDLDDKKKLVCSEMVALFLRWCEIPLQTHIDRVIPKDLWRLADESASFLPRFLHPKAPAKLRRVRKKARALIDLHATCSSSDSSSVDSSGK